MSSIADDLIRCAAERLVELVDQIRTISARKSNQDAHKTGAARHYADAQPR
jgi:hypothetical protein